MACACAKNRIQYQVIVPGGRVAYTSTSKQTADAVAKKYPGSEVKATGPARATAAAPARTVTS
jgi:hypothetical protein